MKRRNRLTICLVVGIVVLAVSATAAFGSVSGYARYKAAVKSFALEAENFTASGSVSLRLDDKEILSGHGDFVKDGYNTSSHMYAEADGETGEWFETYLDGVETSYHIDSQYYSQNHRNDNGRPKNLMSYDKDDEFERRLLAFLDTTADTVAGDLKNTFVQIGSDDGVDIFRVEITRSQVPTLINAALSMAAYRETNGNFQGRIYYDDGYADWFDADEGIEYESYDSILAEHGYQGVIYVHADGSYDYYEDPGMFFLTHPQYTADSLDYYMANEVTLDKITCILGVDHKGNLRQTTATATFFTMDVTNTRHVLEVEFSMTADNFGTAKVQPLDVGDRVLFDRTTVIAQTEAVD